MAKRRSSDAESDTWSLLGTPQKVRIVIVLGKDLLGYSTKVVVPTHLSSTANELLAEALRRVSAMGMVLPKTELVLRLEDHDGPIVFGEDTVEEIINPEEKKITLYVGLPKGQNKSFSNELIYVRWITAGRGLDHSSLSTIPVDMSPIKNDITANAMAIIAFDRIYGDNPLSRQNTRFRIYLSACELPTENTNMMTIKDYGCTGTIEQPLNIFLVPISQNNDHSRIQSFWSFVPSDRGAATFLTCLKMLMLRARSEPTVLRRFLKALFSLIHFPPALEAFHILATQNKLVPKSVVVIATCFQELALRMVPSNLVQDSEASALEGSRQIFSWLFSIYRRSLNEPDIESTALVRRVQLQCLDDATEINFSQSGDRREVVEFDAFGPAHEAAESFSKNNDVENETPKFKFEDSESDIASEHDASSNHSLHSSVVDDSHRTQPNADTDVIKLRKVMVCADSGCKEDLTLLAKAFWGRYDAVTNYYVDFRDTIDKPFEQRHKLLLSPVDFSQILMETNNCEYFQMFSPEELRGKTSTIITMSQGGYVSLYSIKDVVCEGIKHTIENIIEGNRTTDNDPGSEIMTALEPILRQRKLDGTWDIDDWGLAREVKKDGPSPDEAIVICFDLSYSMDSPLGENWIGDGSENTFSRLDETKQVFRNVVARIGSSNVHIGLVTFASRDQVLVRAPLSPASDHFKDELELFTSQGSTALWDGLRRAKDILKTHKSKHPFTKLRVIVLSDGEDNDSLAKPDTVCQEFYDTGIVLDALVIGTRSTKDLFKIVKHTGGYAFCPSSRQLLFQTFLLEPFLDISARPEIERIPVENYWQSEPKEADMRSMYDFPPCRPHPLQDGSFISLSDASRFFSRKSTSLLENTRVSSPHQSIAYRARSATEDMNYPAPQSRSGSSFESGTQRRSDRSGVSFGKLYLDEMRLMMVNPNKFMNVYVKEADMSFWKVVMSGPPESSYKQGTFVIYVHLTQSFPQKAPDVRFITPILHPNITKHGRICHGILSKGWNPDFHIHDVMQDIFGLLATAEPSDAIDEMAALKFWTDVPTAQAEIRKYVRRFAKRSRVQWKNEITNF